MSLSVSTAGSGESPMMRLVKALKPLGDRVLVRHLGLSSFPSFSILLFFTSLLPMWTHPPSFPTEQKTTMQVGSIVLPDSATEKIHQGVVIEVGPGARNPFVSIWHCLRHAPSLCVYPFLSAVFVLHHYVHTLTEPRASSSR